MGWILVVGTGKDAELSSLTCGPDEGGSLKQLPQPDVSWNLIGRWRY